MNVQDAAGLLAQVEDLLSKLTSGRSLLADDAPREGDKRCQLIMRQMERGLRAAEQQVAIASADVMKLVNQAHELRCERRNAVVAARMIEAA